MKASRYTTIKRIILSAMILTPAIPFVLTLLIGFFYFDTSLENTTKSTIERIVRDHGRMIDTFLRERKNDLDWILRSNSYEKVIDPIHLKHLFQLLQKESGAFIDIGVFNEGGDHLAYVGPFSLEGKNYQVAPWFAEVMKKGIYVSDVFLGYRQVPHFIIALSRTIGEKKWIIRATIDTKLFNDLVEEVRIGLTGEAYLVNPNGIFQSQRRSSGFLMEKDLGFAVLPPATEKVQTFIPRGGTDNDYIYAITRLVEKDWTLVVRQEKADAFGALRSAGFRVMFIAVVGGILILTAALFLSRFIVTKIEILDKEKGALGQQLVRASRLAELGEMSAGFAHEINNPLQIMKNELALIQLVWKDVMGEFQLSENENTAQIEDCLNQIQLQINRCGEITQGILKFGRQSEPSPQALDLQSFIPDVVKMISKQAKVNDIDVKQHISKSVPLVYGDPGQLQQVLLNLLNNAMDAISVNHETAGGWIQIEATGVDNETVQISVSDNGCGIDEENQKRIFSPFFTTKPVGKGTGLGLSVCYGIVETMGGRMDCASRPGKGTTFLLNLPIFFKNNALLKVEA